MTVDPVLMSLRTKVEKEDANKDNRLGTPPRPNPHRLSPVIDVTVDPPDGSGTKSLRSYFSHLEIESKNP
jgi:hypothetical protein